MATTARRLTFDDLDAMPEEHEGDRHELIDGELVVTPVPVPNHQIVSVNILYALEQHNREHKLGRVLPAPTGIRLAPDNLLIPDIIFIAQDRLHVIGPRTVDAAPDLVVEILSPGTRQRDLTVKRALHARFGVQEYWIVDPAARTVTVLALAGDRFAPVPHAEGGAIVSRVLPGIDLALDDVFSGTTESR
jgi:Uma2 family endonuclease